MRSSSYQRSFGSITQQLPRGIARVRWNLPTLFIGALLAFSNISSAKGEELDERQSALYHSLVQRAEALYARGAVRETISTYEEALSPLESYGRVHLRLAQLYLLLASESREEEAREQRAWAARHFEQCAGDQRMNALDRDLLCRQRFREMSTPLEVLGVQRAEILRPRAFQGLLQQGRRIPRGKVQLLLTVDRGTQEEIELELPVPRDQWRWRPVLDPRQRDIAIPVDFIASTDAPASVEPADPRMLLPGFLMLGGGIVATTLGLMSDLSYSTGLRSGQIFVRPAARGIWISGVLLTGAGAGWLIWKW